MDELNRWRVGKPKVLTALAEIMVASADELLFMMKALRSKRGMPRLSIPPVGDWLGFYRNHRRLANFFGSSAGLDQKEDPTASDMFAEIRRLGRLATSNPDEFRREVEALAKGDPKEFMAAIDELRRTLAGDHEKWMRTCVDDSMEFDDVEMTRWTSTPEVQFFARVWFPCYLEYRVYPGELMWAARNGDMDALEDLLRLDKSAIFEPRISAQWHRAYHSDGRRHFERIARGLGGRLRGDATMRKVKCALAGLISDFAIKLKHPLTEPEIRALFDAYARAKDKEKLRDGDLPLSSEVLSKAIQRQRRKWNAEKPGVLRGGQKSP